MPKHDSLTQYALDQSRCATVLAEGKARYQRERLDADAPPSTRLLQIREDLAGAIASRSQTRCYSSALDLIVLALRIACDGPGDANT